MTGDRLGEDGQISDEALVRQREHELARAMRTLDVERLDQMLSDDYTFTSSTGEVATKAQALEDLQSPDLHVEELVNQDMQVRVYDGAAVVLGRSVVRGRFGDQDLSGTYRYTRMYVQKGSRWQVVASHLSRMPDR
jgi:ketosteroid isomerase-like protein